MDDDRTGSRLRGHVGDAADSHGDLLRQTAALNVELLGADGTMISTSSVSQAFTAGRAADNTIVIDNDDVSRHHLEVRKEDAVWRIRDLGSANGVYIGDRLIESEEELLIPCLVSLGLSGVRLRLTQTTRPGPDGGTTVSDRAASRSDDSHRESGAAPQGGGTTGQPARWTREAAADTAYPTAVRSFRQPLDQTATPGVDLPQHPEPLCVGVLDADGRQIATYALADHFTVGRAADNTVVIDNRGVSRHHLEVRNDHGRWRVINLGSANGVYIDDNLVEHDAELALPALVALGQSGIWLDIRKASPEAAKGVACAPGRDAAPAQADGPGSPPQKPRSLAEEDIKARLLAQDEAADSGDYTRIVRRIIHEDRVIRKRSYRKVIWALGILFGLSISMAGYQQVALANTRKLALEMFYDIKTLEVSLSQADIKLEQSADTLDKAMAAISTERLRVVDEQLKAEREKIAAERKRMLQEREKLAAMKGKYRQYVDEANSLRLRFPTAKRYEEELIAKVTSELGESELELPDDFVAEVRKYIKYWQGSARMKKAMDNIEKNNYLPIVTGALKKHGLPLYFVYLPLQESNYDAQAIGPSTRFGIAKGAWQLLATTAQEYGVAAGPLADVAAYDPQDARFDFQQSTQAGVKYLKRIYSSEAQASGLLVMASYNYGDTRVRKMIREMPDNPRERNFWRFVRQYQLPKETHDYVFYILSAAVIGEDPKHFGFEFSPPLFMAEADRKADSGASGQKHAPR